MTFDPTTLLGPLGGQLAIAFGAGCVAGYAFCLRTVYKLLEAHKDKDHQSCIEQIKELKEENSDLRERITVLEDRWFMGSNRQSAQVRESTVRVLGADRLGEDYKS